MSAARPLSVIGVPQSERTLLAHAVYWGARLNVAPGSIEKPALKILAHVIADRQRDNKTVDRASIADALQHHRAELAKHRTTPEELLESLADSTSAAHLEWHEAEVTRTAQARALQTLLVRRAADAACDADIDDLVERTKVDLDNIRAQGAPATSPVACASSIPIERVEWLWQHRIAAGMINVLDGDPGLGKSTITTDLAARLTRGEALPGDTVAAPPTGVVFVSFEEHPACVMVPRLMAAKADLSRVFIWNLSDRPFDLVNSLAELERTITANNARLVVIDPLMAALPSELNAHRDQDVRSVLAPVAGLAERTGAAILLVRHLNKNPAGGAVYRGGGSIGIIGAARVGLLLATDPDAEDDAAARVLAVSKCNVARLAPPMRLRLVPAPSPAPGVEVARIEWGGESKASADELVAPRDEKGAIGRAIDLLRNVMKDGPVPAFDAQAALRANDVSPRTEARAKERLHVVAKREGVSRGKWWWYLPEHLPPSHSARTPQ